MIQPFNFHIGVCFDMFDDPAVLKSIISTYLFTIEDKNDKINLLS